jgi:hypothetical protein
VSEPLLHVNAVNGLGHLQLLCLPKRRRPFIPEVKRVRLKKSNMGRVEDSEIYSRGSAVCIRNSPKFSWQDDLGRQQSEIRFHEMGQSRETI